MNSARVFGSPSNSPRIELVTGDITADYLSQLAVDRDEARGEADLLEEEKEPT